MATRVIWVFLWPVVLAFAYVDTLVRALVCGDDGPADEGDAEAGRFCDRID